MAEGESKGIDKSAIDWAENANRETDKIDNLEGISEESREKLKLGHVLDRILGDDANAIEEYRIRHKFTKPDISQYQLLHRLNWEISSGMLPQDLADKLDETAKELAETDWNDPENHRNIFDRWHKMHDEVEEIVDDSESLTDARKSYADWFIQGTLPQS